jgi:hypothetical protein
LGIGDWGLGIGPNPQSPIPNPQFLQKNNLKIFNYFPIFQKLIDLKNSNKDNLFYSNTTKI